MNKKMTSVKKLIGYTEEDDDNINELQDATDFSFTEIQRKIINNFFFSKPENLDAVFGEEEDEDDEEDEED